MDQLAGRLAEFVLLGIITCNTNQLRVLRLMISLRCRCMESCCPYATVVWMERSSRSPPRWHHRWSGPFHLVLVLGRLRVIRKCCCKTGGKAHTYAGIIVYAISTTGANGIIPLVLRETVRVFVTKQFNERRTLVLSGSSKYSFIAASGLLLLAYPIY